MVSRGFTPRRIASLEPRIRKIADELVGAFETRGACELMEEFANPLPVSVIAELMGLDPARREDFKRWSTALIVGSPLLVYVISAVLIMSAVGGARWAPLTVLYVRLIRPRFASLQPVRTEPAGPPAFAQRLGAGFTAAASLSLAAGVDWLGWTLAAVVAALAFLAATARICVGCLIYERLER